MSANLSEGVGRLRGVSVLTAAVVVLASAGTASVLGSPASAQSPTVGATAGQTFTVTSTSCTGPGSLGQAVSDANANPGTDTIQFDKGLIVKVRACPTPGKTGDKYFLATVTDSVVFDGNGATLQGDQWWGWGGGTSATCPDPKNIIKKTPGFLNVAADQQVMVSGLSLDKMEAIARVQQGAGLTMTDVKASNIRPITTCKTPAISAASADVTLTANTWSVVQGWAGTSSDVPTAGAIAGTGHLVVDRSLLTKVGNGGTVLWTGGRFDLVSTIGTEVEGMTTVKTATNIVNSLWVPTATTGTPLHQDRLANLSLSASDKWNIQASTILFSSVACSSSNCTPGPDLGWLTTKSNGKTFDGPIGLKQSAVGALTPASQSSPNPTWLTGNFTADQDTWLQGDLGINDAGLKALTGQPALLTGRPALPVYPDDPQSVQEWATPLLGTNATPGLLIDEIPNADCGQANELINPIDGSCIAKDVFGNPRVDNNGKRNIGAVQNSFAPLLSVTDTKKTSITVAWTQPLDPPSGPVTGYTLSYRPVGASSWTTVNVSGATTLTKQVGGLTPDTEYEFKVVGVNASGDGPPSNVVSATTLPDPHLSYPDGVGQKGKKISPLVPHVQDVAVPRSFSLIKGSLPPGLKLDSDTGAITGTPTKAGSFGFTVLVTGANNSAASTKVTIKVQAGPLSPALSYPKGKGEQGERLVPLVPHTSGLSGAVRYRLVSGSLPSGVRLNASTGRITGKPAEHGSFRAKIKVTGNSGSATSPVTLKIRKSPTPTTQLKVTARRQNKSLPVGSATKVVTRVRSDGRVVVRTACEVNGVRVGKYCRTTVTKKHAVTVTPACNDKVTYTVRITAKSKGQARSAWTRTWNVAKKPFTPCRSGGTG